MMKQRSFSTTIQTATRLILLTCVLASLCISTAEGIRLLPFPDSSAENGNASFQGNLSNSYSESLREASNLKSDSSAKSRKGNQPPVQKAIGLSAFKRNHFFSVFSSSVNRESGEFYSLQIASKPKGRAPPA